MHFLPTTLEMGRRLVAELKPYEIRSGVDSDFVVRPKLAVISNYVRH